MKRSAMHYAFEKAVAIAEEVGCFAIVLDVMSDGDEVAYTKRVGPPKRNIPVRKI